MEQLPSFSIFAYKTNVQFEFVVMLKLNFVDFKI